MDIREIGPSGLPPQRSPRKRKSAEGSEKRNRDLADVSSAARALFEIERKKKLDMVRDRIRDGFYYRTEVTERVAEAITYALNKAPKSEN